MCLFRRKAFLSVTVTHVLASKSASDTLPAAARFLRLATFDPNKHCPLTLISKKLVFKTPVACSVAAPTRDI